LRGYPGQGKRQFPVALPFNPSGFHCGDVMKDKLEKTKQDIELRYLPIEEQEKKTGYIFGNSFFDERQLLKLKRFKDPNSDEQLTELKRFRAELKRLESDKEKRLKQLKRFKPNRDKIWKDIEGNFKPQQVKRIAGIIEDGFIYLADDNVIRKYKKDYQDGKKKILNYVKKQNEKLSKENPYFKVHPIQINISPHPFGSSTMRGRPMGMQGQFIKQLSDELKDHFKVKDQRAKFIQNIFRFFFAVPKDQIPYRNIRQHF
jgi:hypothetical protein